MGGRYSNTKWGHKLALFDVQRRRRYGNATRRVPTLLYNLKKRLRVSVISSAKYSTQLKSQMSKYTQPKRVLFEFTVGGTLEVMPYHISHNLELLPK